MLERNDIPCRDDDQQAVTHQTSKEVKHADSSLEAPSLTLTANVEKRLKRRVASHELHLPVDGRLFTEILLLKRKNGRPQL